MDGRRTSPVTVGRPADWQVELDTYDPRRTPPRSQLRGRNSDRRRRRDQRACPVGADAAITANQLAGSNKNVPVSLSRLASLTRAGSGVFWLTARGGQIVQIGEQWSP